MDRVPPDTMKCRNAFPPSRTTVWPFASRSTFEPEGMSKGAVREMEGQFTVNVTTPPASIAARSVASSQEETVESAWASAGVTTPAAERARRAATNHALLMTGRDPNPLIAASLPGMRWIVPRPQS
jgi:hypothetical protein